MKVLYWKEWRPIAIVGFCGFVFAIVVSCVRWGKEGELEELEWEEEDKLSVDEMYEGLEVMAWSSDYYRNGVWEPDWDDAAFYGPAFYIRAGLTEGNDDYTARAKEANDRNLLFIEDCLRDTIDVFVANIGEILCGILGAIEYIAATGDASGLRTVDDAIDRTNLLSSVFGRDYLETMRGYAAETYGPTVITAMVAIVNLQYAVLLDTSREGERIEKARVIIERIDEEAWGGSYYLFAPSMGGRESSLYLYPNIVMMITLTRMYQATGEEEFLRRAESLYGAIQPLRCPHPVHCPGRPGYRSPYSADEMGARTEDYSTLSAMNYAMFAFGLLAHVTGKEVYLREVDMLLGFVKDYLYVPADGRAYHHWMDGRLALPSDPEYFCIGCNLQLLYLIWWFRSNFDPRLLVWAD